MIWPFQLENDLQNGDYFKRVVESVQNKHNFFTKRFPIIENCTIFASLLEKDPKEIA